MKIPTRPEERDPLIAAPKTSSPWWKQQEHQARQSTTALLSGTQPAGRNLLRFARGTFMTERCRSDNAGIANLTGRSCFCEQTQKANCHPICIESFQSQFGSCGHGDSGDTLNQFSYRVFQVNFVFAPPFIRLVSLPTWLFHAASASSTAEHPLPLTWALPQALLLVEIPCLGSVSEVVLPHWTLSGSMMPRPSLSVHVVSWTLYTFANTFLQHQEDDSAYVIYVSRSFSGPHSSERKRDRERRRGGQRNRRWGEERA